MLPNITYCVTCLQTQCLTMFGEVDDHNSIKTFHEVGLAFIKPIKQVGRFTNNKYILVTIDYVTKWMEAKTFQINVL